MSENHGSAASYRVLSVPTCSPYNGHVIGETLNSDVVRNLKKWLSFFKSAMILTSLAHFLFYLSNDLLPQKSTTSLVIEFKIYAQHFCYSKESIKRLLRPTTSCKDNLIL